jgi:release factor glutamine methyltransferase
MTGLPPVAPGESDGAALVDDGGQTWRELLNDATALLGSVIDARRLAEQASGMELAELLTNLNLPVPARAGRSLAAMVARRVAGEPLQYALGRWGFRSLDLMVDHRVLIPRPETEQVAGAAIAEARRMAAANRDRRLVLADLGTGSGAIALSLAAEVPGAGVWATDASRAALEVASANLTGLGTFAATRVRLAHGSWYEALPPDLLGSLDLIVSNPPYIALDEQLPPEVATYEPVEALRSGPSGLECLTEVVSGAPPWLAPRGVLVVELAPHQADSVSDMARQAGFTDVEVRPDLAGRQRMVVARR